MNIHLHLLPSCSKLSLNCCSLISSPHDPLPAPGPWVEESQSSQTCRGVPIQIALCSKHKAGFRHPGAGGAGEELLTPRFCALKVSRSREETYDVQKWKQALYLALWNCGWKIHIFCTEKLNNKQHLYFPCLLAITRERSRPIRTPPFVNAGMTSLCDTVKVLILRAFNFPFIYFSCTIKRHHLLLLKCTVSCKTCITKATLS